MGKGAPPQRTSCSAFPEGSDQRLTEHLAKDGGYRVADLSKPARDGTCKLPFARETLQPSYISPQCQTCAESDPSCSRIQSWLADAVTVRAGSDGFWAMKVPCLYPQCPPGPGGLSSAPALFSPEPAGIVGKLGSQHRCRSNDLLGCWTRERDQELIPDSSPRVTVTQTTRLTAFRCASDQGNMGETCIGLPS